MMFNAELIGNKPNFMLFSREKPNLNGWVLDRQSLLVKKIRANGGVENVRKYCNHYYKSQQSM